MTRAYIRLLAYTLILLCLSWCSYSAFAQEGEVKVGVLFPLTGDAASYGERGKNGIALAVEEINAQGGIRGRKLRVIYEDSRAEPKTGVAAMMKLVTVDKVPVVIGDIVSAVTLPAAPIAESNKVVLLSPTASAPAITDAGDYVFRISPSDLAEGAKLATFGYQAGFRKVGVLYIQNDYGLGIKDVFTKTLTQLGGQITTALGYKSDESDFRPYLTKVAATKPDAIYIVSYYKDGALAMKQARELGIQTQFLATTAIEDSKVLEIAGTAAEGLIYPLSTGYDAESPEEAVQRFRTRYKERYTAEPDWAAALSYDAMMLVAHVMEKAGLSGPEIQQTMAQVKGYRGVTGDITFDEHGDVVKPVVMKVIKDGKFQKFQERN